MYIREEQLVSWSKQPSTTEVDKIARTHSKVREAIEKYFPVEKIKKQHNLAQIQFDIFLQGSYKNDTNIRLNSDVDVVVKLDSVWGYDLSGLTEEHRYNYKKAGYVKSSYTFDQYRSDISLALENYFGKDQIKPSPKCLKMGASASTVDVDIIPAFIYKKFKWFQHEAESGHDFIEGIKFKNIDKNHDIINYPKEHRKRLTLKHDATNQNFKKMVRVFKNIRLKLLENGKISENEVKGYFIENLLYNTTEACYQGNLTAMTINIVQQLLDDASENRLFGYRCANGQDNLFSPSTWNFISAGKFITATTDYLLKGK